MRARQDHRPHLWLVRQRAHMRCGIGPPWCSSAEVVLRVKSLPRPPEPRSPAMRTAIRFLPSHRRAVAPLTIALAIAAITAGCGGGPVVDDAANAGAKALRGSIKASSSQRIGWPRPLRGWIPERWRPCSETRSARASGCSSRRAASRPARSGGRSPSRGCSRSECPIAPPSQAVSLYENLAYGLQTGEFDLAKVELYRS
jgi:hypothetical protein